MGIKFSGINLYTKNPAKAFEFYKDIGLKVASEGNINDEWFGAAFHLTALEDGPRLWLWKDNDNRDTVNQKNQIVIGCEDMDATYEELKTKGYAVTDPELMFYGGREMNLTDVDGNLILFLD